MDIESLMKRIEADLMSEDDVILLRMIISGTPSQDDIDGLLSRWNFETEGAAKSLLLSYLLKAHPELDVQESIVKRIKGISEYYRLRNMKLIAHFIKIASKLSELGIKVTVFKGGAMKILRPELSRRMSDIDVLVRENEYKTAGRAIEGMGYDVSWDEHSFDVHQKGSDEGILDVHKFIPMLTGRESAIMDDVLDRAKDADLFGAKGRILMEEDLVFSLLVNLSRNIMNNTSTGGILSTFADIDFIIDSKPDFNWDMLVENARRSGSEKMLSFAVRFINSTVPGFLPDFIKVNDSEFVKIANIVEYRRYLLCPLQARSHQLGLAAVLKSPGLIPDFLKVRPRYTLLKIFRKRPVLAGLILSLHK